MHDIEPYYNWRNFYIADEDPKSPFFKKEYSEFFFEERIYDHYIHPQWDNIGSPTLFIKILYADYDEGNAVIELMGEWNDCLHNDIMYLKRDIAEILMEHGINKFLLIGENILNFHSSDDCYYEEWFEEVEDQGGWIDLLNLRDHVLKEITDANLDYFFVTGGQLENLQWRTYQPDQLMKKVEGYVMKRLC
ncbi:MAG: hypothetical protein ABEH43_00280 [Flavobacteriales bacterium]